VEGGNVSQHGYKYRLKPLVVPGLMFLILYPLFVGALYLITKFSTLELKILVGIYAATALGILSTWVYASGKSIRVEEDRIVFKTIFGAKNLTPADIRKIVLFWTPQKKEVAQIVTKRDTYYICDLYFAYPELMANIERFVKMHHIRSNFASLGE